MQWLAEYAMAFYDYEAVVKVKRERDVQKSLEEEDTTIDVFAKQVEQMFGRPLSKGDMKRAREHLTPVGKETETIPKTSMRQEIEKDIIKVSKPNKDPQEKRVKKKD